MPKKKKQVKKRKSKYDEVFKIEGTFDEVMKHIAQKANEKKLPKKKS